MICRFKGDDNMGEIKTLSIDLETYSDIDIRKAGAYRYAESPVFEILLFGVSINEGEVVVYDLASGDVIPDEILQALIDNSVTKSTFNAVFEYSGVRVPLIHDRIPANRKTIPIRLQRSIRTTVLSVRQ